MPIHIVCLPTAAQAPALSYEYLRATEALVSTDHGTATLVQLPQILTDKNVWVVLPVNRLSWHAVALPKGIGPNSPRLRSVLNSLLEDRLLDDPGQMHLAMGKSSFTDQDTAAMYWVGACDKAWLQAHLNAIKSAGMVVSRIVPEFAPTHGETRVHVVGGVDQPLLVATGQLVSGVICLPFNNAALALLPRACVGAEPVAQAAQLTFAEPAVLGLVERLLPGDIRPENRHTRWLAATGSGWELAQFDLACTSRARTFKRVWEAGVEMLQSRRWRFARWAMAVLLGIHVAGLNALAWQEKSALHAQRLSIQNMLVQTFPHVKVVVDAPLQMQRELAALEQSKGGASAFGLEAALNAIGAAGLPDQTLNAIEMANGEIKLKGLALASQELSGLSAQLSEQGFAVVAEGDVLRIKPLNQKGVAP
jgi:general secretion pathway protein L